MKPRFLLTAFVLMVGSAVYSLGQQPTAAYTFECTGNSSLRIGNCPQGGRPGSLIQGSDGNFYGTAEDSMEGSSSPTGGTVFSLTPAGKFTLLHSFAPGTNNDYPNGDLAGSLAEGPDGKLYGDTLFGAIDGCNGYCGYGILYRINTDGSGFRIIHKFCSQTNCTDGWAGYAGLVTGSDGNLYGTTYYGGTGNSGTIFRVTPATGTYKVVFNFSFSTTGENPSGLIVAPDGTFYGLSASSLGELLFHYTPATGTLGTVVLNFPLINGLPSHGGDLIFGPNGNFYGLYGVYAKSGEGVFEVQTDGSNLQLFPFYTTQDGAGEPDGLVLASDGNFWMANLVGTNGKTSFGNIIELSSSDGSLLQTLSPFSSGAAVGAFPTMIMQAKDGLLWGTTDFYGKAPKGQFADGTVFSLNGGLPPR